MGEQLGGKEHKWSLLDIGRLFHCLSIVLGWALMLVAPLIAVLKVYSEGLMSPRVYLEASDIDWKVLGEAIYQWGKFAVFHVWLVLAYLGFTTYLVSFLEAFKKPMNASGSERDCDKKSDQGGTKVGNEARLGNASQSGGEKNAPTPTNREEEKRRKEKENRDRNDRIEAARKELRRKSEDFRKGFPASQEITYQESTIDFAEAVARTGLSIEPRNGVLKHGFLTWNAESKVLKIEDAFAFWKNRTADIDFLLSDPNIVADSDLKNDVPSEPIRFHLKAKYPPNMEEFFKWKEKAQAVVRLDNAKQGQDVSYDLADILGIDTKWAVWTEVSGHGALKADKDSFRLQGSPKVGNATIRITFACRGAEGIRHDLDLQVTCIMDAEQLWKQIEDEDSDKPSVVPEDEASRLAKMAEAVRNTSSASEVAKPDERFSKPHRVSRRQRAGDFDVTYASIRGRSHVKSASFREDHADARFFHDGKAVAIVVSDGAGSAPLSRRGSCIVASVGVSSLVELGEKLLREPDSLKERGQATVDGFAKVVRDIRTQIEFEAELIKELRPEFQSKEMYATFLAALILPHDGGQVLLTYSAGDGAIGLGLAGETSGLRCVPDHGQSAGQTLFILNKGADDADRRLLFARLPESYCLMLMSDGVSDPRFSHGEEGKPETWDRLAEELKDVVVSEPIGSDGEKVETYKERGALCAWLDSYEKSHHDDRTIAVLCHKLS